MLFNILAFLGAMVLFLFFGASIYVSLFNHKDDSQPIYHRKKKLSFDRSTKVNLS